ncbi:MAG: dienelactone hydrolase family protein [Planctomycetota bacterium]
MRMPSVHVLFIFILASPLAMSAEEPARRQSAQRLVARPTVEMDYLLYLPRDYDRQPSWPLLLFLHGAGERGEDLSRVKIHGPPKLIEQGRDFPFVIVSPQCAEGQAWQPPELHALLDDVIAKTNIDLDRVYVTGLSMGGFGTWDLACSRPQRFAAIAPICGGGRDWWVGELKTLPVWAFHGSQDTVVPPERSQELVDRLRAMGSDPKLTLYPDAAHDSWTVTYDNPELYEWFLSHSRKDRP